MKLVEKKCPNCGASLSFNANDKEVTCKYCNVSFLIEHDNDQIINTDKVKELADSILDPSTFNLQRKMVKNFSKVFIFVWVFIFIIFLIVFFTVFFNIFNHGIR